MSASEVQSSVSQAGAADDHANRSQKVLYKMASDWTNLPAGHKLRDFQDQLKEILEATGYKEMYGVELQAPVDG